MDHHATRPTDREAARRWTLAVVGVIAAVMAGRAVWLATHPRVDARRVAEAVASVSHHPPATAVASVGSVQRPTHLTIEEYAAIAGLCPTALDELPASMLPPEVRAATEPAATSLEVISPEVMPPHTRTAARDAEQPAGRLTGIRLASRGTTMPLGVSARIAQAPPADDGWLVSPDAWFAPEDRAAPRAASPAETPIAEPASEESSEEAAPAPSLAPQSTPADDSAVAPLEPPAATVSPATPWPVDPAPKSPYPDTSEAPPHSNLHGGFDAGPAFAPPGVASPEPMETPAESMATAEDSVPTETPPITEPLLEDPAAEQAVPKTPPEPVGPAWSGRFDSVVPSEADDIEATSKSMAPLDAPAPTTEETPEAPTEEPAFEAPALAPSIPTPAEVAPPTEVTDSVPAEPAPEAEEPAARPTPLVPPQPVAEPVIPRPQTVAPTPRPQVLPPVAPQGSLFTAPKAAHPGGGAQAAAEANKAAGGKSADESHRELFAKDNYPSALQCAECHQRIYDEWSVSSHAYAYVSPMFHKFEQTITNLSNGTVGHFCTRCHSPVATAMYEPRSMPLGEMAMTAREGVTCIVCHRVNQRWGKSNGERRIEPGDIYAPVYGGIGGDGVAEVAAKAKEFKVKLSPEDKGPGVAMHTEGRFFDQLTMAEACTSCHQVAVHPGVKLEVVWEQYRASPACKKGITCQECHMGRVPGLPGGFNMGPIAEINGKAVNNHRRQTSHVFYGPGYSIAHPGVFPQHKKAQKWTLDEWMLFDWRAGWGTDEFEEKIEEQEDNDVDTAKWFPPVWADPDDRCDAREIVDDNLDRLAMKRRYRELVMENGSKVDGPFFRQQPTAGRDLVFDYVVTNMNEGHNMPTASLGAQPQLWANVVLIAPDGRRVWESGYTDSNGDLCDIHSVDVREGRAPFDKQLFNLQTMFLITGATGTDREFYLPVNLSFDQVAQLRPGAQPITVLNHPPFIRMESRSLAPLGRKQVKYTVPAELLRQPGRYRLSFRLRNRTEPMYFMRLCESTPEMLRAMTEGTLDFHPQSVEFDVY
jgi:hypothetical protein